MNRFDCLTLWSDEQSQLLGRVFDRLLDDADMNEWRETIRTQVTNALTRGFHIRFCTDDDAFRAGAVLLRQIDAGRSRALNRFQSRAARSGNTTRNQEKSVRLAANDCIALRLFVEFVC